MGKHNTERDACHPERSTCHPERSESGKTSHVVHALIPGKTVGAQFIGAPPMYRPRGLSMRSPGRYIGGAGMNAPPTGYYRCCLVNFIISSGSHPRISRMHHHGDTPAGGLLLSAHTLVAYDACLLETERRSRCLILTHIPRWPS